MSNIADQADAVIAHDLRVNIHRASRHDALPAATGHCHNCGQPLPDKRRWCDAACRDEWLIEEGFNGH